MKRALKIFIFIALFVGLLAGFSRVFEPKDNLKELGMQDVKANGILGENKNSIEVLVIGDSEAYSSISPMQIYQDRGFSTYVCATSAQYLFESVNYLNKALERQKPKVVILETNAIFRKFSTKEKLAYDIENYFSVFRYHDMWKRLRINSITKTVDYTYTDDYKGFYINKSIVPSNVTNHMKYNENFRKIPKKNIKKVEEIISICKKNDIKLVLWSTPSTVNWNYRKHNSIERFAKERNIEYIDLNLIDLGIDWRTDTRDAGDHLNYMGAVKVTNYLTNYLDGLNILKDNRNDKRFEHWNKSLIKYNNEASLV